jgi:tetratricopeptide (TPR) repeat protein
MDPQDLPPNGHEPTTSVTKVSGGVNVDAEQVNIGGDVVGGDKITEITWIRQFVMSPWAWIGSIVILVIGLIAIATILNAGQLYALLPTPTLLPTLTPSPTLKPSPTPLAFAPATKDQSLIIVANFEDRSGGKYQGIDPAQYIYEKLKEQVQNSSLDIRVERMRQSVDDSDARAIGEVYSATLVLWGWYDTLAITPRIERITLTSDSFSTEEDPHLNISDPAKVELSVVEDLPSSSAYLVLLIIGLSEGSNADYDRAFTYCSSALSSLPLDGTASVNPGEAYFCRGTALFYKTEYNKAIAEYDKAIEFMPDYDSAYYNRGWAYRHVGDYDRAIADYTKAIQLKPDNGSAYINRGAAYEYKGDYNNAVKDASTAIQLMPNYALGYHNRGHAYYLLRNYVDALKDFDQAIQLKPDYAEAYFGRGNVHDDLGDHDSAVKDFNEAIRLKPDYAEAYVNRGVAYYNMGDYGRAIENYDTAIQLEPNDANAYNSRGYTYYTMGNYDQAIQDLNEAIKLNPGYGTAFHNRGLTYYESGDYDSAIDDFTKVLEIAPNNVLAYYNRGRAEDKKGDHRLAIADFKKVLELTSGLMHKFCNELGQAYC